MLRLRRMSGHALRWTGMALMLGVAHRAPALEGGAATGHDTSVEHPGPRAHTQLAPDRFAQDGKIRGVNLVAGRPFGEETWRPLLRDNVEWVCLGPFGWQDGIQSTEVGLRTRHVMWCESDTGIVTITREAHARGLHVILKPQIWLMDRSGHWLGDIDPGSEAGWRAWFASYREFILHYAELSDQAGIELLVVGAELRTATREHPEAWRALIADVRRIYAGRLTYGANWADEVNEIAFWDALDYVGVQAYYPLSASPDPGIEDLARGWEPHLRALTALHERTKKPIFFTEIGWKSTSAATIRPWEWTEHTDGAQAQVSTKTQENAYAAFYRTVWGESWFAGACVWKWYARHERAGGPEDPDFTPQNKPAEAVMALGFGG